MHSGCLMTKSSLPSFIILDPETKWRVITWLSRFNCLSFLLQSDLPILYFLIMSRATFKVWSFVMCLMHHLLDRQRLEISHKARLSKAQCSLIFGFCPCVCVFFFWHRYYNCSCSPVYKTSLWLLTKWRVGYLHPRKPRTVLLKLCLTLNNSIVD